VIAPSPNPIPRVSSGVLGFYNNTDETEALLDVEWAHAVAPGASLKVYVENPAHYPDTDMAELQALTNALHGRLRYPRFRWTRHFARK
jgi:subtilase family serine protease